LNAFSSIIGACRARLWSPSRRKSLVRLFRSHLEQATCWDKRVSEFYPRHQSPGAPSFALIAKDGKNQISPSSSHNKRHSAKRLCSSGQCSSMSAALYLLRCHIRSVFLFSTFSPHGFSRLEIDARCMSLR